MAFTSYKNNDIVSMFFGKEKMYCWLMMFNYKPLQCGLSLTCYFTDSAFYFLICMINVIS